LSFSQNICGLDHLEMATATVLVVDDDPLFLDAVSKSLSRNSYRLLIAHGPREALVIARHKSPIDVVISDVWMPTMSGPELVRTLAQIIPETAFILMTGGLVDSACTMPDVPHLRKPFSRVSLITAVEAAIARSVELRAKHTTVRRPAGGDYSTRSE
jgi:DNA-binding NtrC family response regulator